MTTYTIGYARTSTRQQDLGLQRDAILKAGVEPDNIFEEQESGAKRNRPILNDVLSRLRPGDTLMVWKLDRLARSLSHLIEIVEGLAKRGVAFRSLTEEFDTSTPAGKMFFQVVGAMAEFERNLIEERREAGIAKARADGVKFGRKLLSDPQSTAKKGGALAQAMLAAQGGMSLRQAAKAHGVDRITLSRHLNRLSTPEVSNLVSKPKSKANGHMNGLAAAVV
jgi:DNA invertase Pin-like site-specific DNA recombinase